SYKLADWRSGLLDTDAATDSIVEYLDSLHRGVSKSFGCHPQLDCCHVDQAITAQGKDLPPPAVQTSGPRWAALAASADTTLPKGWEDNTEMLDRMRQELPRVEVHAKAIHMGIGCAHELEDLMGFGYPGLIFAARSFAENKGVPFSAWVALCVRASIIDGV